MEEEGTVSDRAFVSRVIVVVGRGGSNGNSRNKQKQAETRQFQKKQKKQGVKWKRREKTAWGPLRVSCVYIYIDQGKYQTSRTSTHFVVPAEEATGCAKHGTRNVVDQSPTAYILACRVACLRLIMTQNSPAATYSLDLGVLHDLELVPAEMINWPPWRAAADM